MSFKTRVADAVAVSHHVDGDVEGAAVLPVRKLGSRFLRWFGGQAGGDPPGLQGTPALLRLGPKPRLEVRGDLVRRALVTRRLDDVRGGWSQERWREPGQSRILRLGEVSWLREQDIS